MYQFFIEETQLAGDKISILGSDVNHIKHVLRMKPGERVRISISDNGQSFFGKILEITEEEVRVQVEEEDKNGTELENRIYLFQGLPKGDKMEWIIQKSVELGVHAIIPVAMKNCVVKLEEKKAAAKQKRWQAISESAAKQSKRTCIPKIHLPVSWKQAVQKAEDLDIVLVPYENARGMEATRKLMQQIQPGQSIGIFIGPEGGFSPEEIAQIAPLSDLPEDAKAMEIDCAAEREQSEAGAKTAAYRISLGRRILRTETAGLAALAMLIFCLEE